MLSIYGQNCKVSDGRIEVEELLRHLYVLFVNCKPKCHQKMVLVLLVPM